MFRSPKLVHWIYPNRVWGKDTTSKTVYLTFDDGPIPEITEWILDTLLELEIKATFFCVGSNVEKHPAIYQRILNEGHNVGNHTMYHDNGFQTKLTPYVQSVNETEALVKSKLFRPPYGRMKRSQEKEILHMGYEIVMWSWLAKDYDHSISSQKIIQAAAKIKGGDILVYHDNEKAFEKVKETLVPVIETLKSKGYQFATL